MPSSALASTPTSVEAEVSFILTLHQISSGVAQISSGATQISSGTAQISSGAAGKVLEGVESKDFQFLDVSLLDV